MNNDLVVFDNIVSKIKKDGFIENYNVYQTLEGYKKLELQIQYSNNYSSFFIITDNGNIIDKREITIRPFSNKKERNKEIKRLFFKEGMTQVFIGKVFRLSQSTISGIVNS
ncbi:hypothetical protein [Clostridium perfringens]|uniref:hypothetical protein n=1 Tax=Clostridium perfringens TaxID=1502 RepID=UPI001CB31A27|nr:hypothetical protein [Clostridium perfringens]MDU4075079.1 hypothetical protein [Clostridium perfringens]HBI7100385.1 hypothetical protein [Clostridium perfringens]HBI7113457.1 hypothetical protein [Clostridium perfringens]HBI7116807.1 hypothetical protein [Clostridium perfringens]HBI7123037.1 hypothetical protein [Clostridium perfringens]